MLILDRLEGLRVSGGVGILILQPCVRKPATRPGSLQTPNADSSGGSTDNAINCANQHN